MSGPFGLGRELACSRQRVDAGPKSGSGKSLGRVVGVPSLWPRRGGVLQQHGLGVIRPSGSANAGAGAFVRGTSLQILPWLESGVRLSTLKTEILTHPGVARRSQVHLPQTDHKF